MPVNEYYEYFGPEYRLDVLPSNMENLNTRTYLDKVKEQVFENLRHVAHAPSVQGHVEPRLAHDMALDDQDDEDDDPDVRASDRVLDQRVQRDTEIDDSDDEGEGDRRDRHNWKEDAMDMEAGETKPVVAEAPPAGDNVAPPSQPPPTLNTSASPATEAPHTQREASSS